MAVVDLYHYDFENGFVYYCFWLGKVHQWTTFNSLNTLHNHLFMCKWTPGLCATLHRHYTSPRLKRNRLFLAVF